MTRNLILESIKARHISTFASIIRSISSIYQPKVLDQSTDTWILSSIVCNTSHVSDYINQFRVFTPESLHRILFRGPVVSFIHLDEWEIRKFENLKIHEVFWINGNGLRLHLQSIVLQSKNFTMVCFERARFRHA